MHPLSALTLAASLTGVVLAQPPAPTVELARALLAGSVPRNESRLELPAVDDAKKPLVVLVHGLDSSPASLADLRAFLEAEPRALPVATFVWPDDGPLEVVATALAAKLRAVGDRPIVVVAHSAGGLIARAAIERAEHDPGNVTRLVLIGPPNGGSRLAALRAARDVHTFVRDVADGPLTLHAVLDAGAARWRDGRGEGGRDLRPGSRFLTMLAALPRNPRVHYHLVLGTRAPLPVGPRALDELRDGRGDGLVAVRAAGLPGVEPVLVWRDHRGLVRRRGQFGPELAPDEHPVFRLVAEWIATPVGSTHSGTPKARQ
jgi:pimeloyl-ACP methyl ester carboxylesterase